MLNEEAAFLKAIALQPGDDNVRLVYADWLTENGDPDRGELIRLQCSLERGIDWRDSATAEGERLEEIRAREQELIENMLAPREAGEEPGVREFTTTPEIAAILAKETQRITFKRGMIDKLNLNTTRITKLPPNLYVGGNLDLSIIGLWGSNITELPPDLHVGGNLYLVNTAITELPPDLHVGGSLNLVRTNFTAETASRILDMPNLSREAKITGLESAGFPALAAEARRNARLDDGPDTPSRQ